VTATFIGLSTAALAGLAAVLAGLAAVLAGLAAVLAGLAAALAGLGAAFGAAAVFAGLTEAAFGAASDAVLEVGAIASRADDPRFDDHTGAVLPFDPLPNAARTVIPTEPFFVFRWASPPRA
jgi:hypothetical protein